MPTAESLADDNDPADAPMKLGPQSISPVPAANKDDEFVIEAATDLDIELEEQLYEQSKKFAPPEDFARGGVNDRSDDRSDDRIEGGIDDVGSDPAARGRDLEVC